MGTLFRVMNFLSGDKLRSIVAYELNMSLKQALYATGEQKDNFIHDALDGVSNLLRL